MTYIKNNDNIALEFISESYDCYKSVVILGKANTNSCNCILDKNHNPDMLEIIVDISEMTGRKYLYNF